MKRIFTILLISLCFAYPANAQHYLMHTDIPVDSSYSARNEFKKHIKKYPIITLAEPGNTDNLIGHNDLVYVRYGKRELHLDLVKPKTTNPKLPVIVIIHAGGWRSGENI